MKPYTKLIFRILISGTIISLLIASPLSADDTWNGDGADDLTSNGDNWVDNGAPGVGSEGNLTFGADSGNYVVTVDAAYTAVGNIDFTGAGAAYAIGESGAGNLGFAGGSAITNPVAFTHTISSSMTSAGLTFNLANALTVSGAIAGTTITKSGSAALTLSGNNTYTGVTNLNAGTIILGHDSALGTGAGAILTLGADGAIQSDNDSRAVSNAIDLATNGLTVSGASNLTLSGVISSSGGGGTLTTNMTADGDTLTLTGTNTYAGGTTLTQGTIILGANAALGTGALTLGGAGTLQSNNDTRAVSNAIANGGFGLTVSGGSDLALSGVISGTGTLTTNMTADGDKLTLSGTNTYSGGTTLTKGTMILGANAALGTGALTLGGNGSLQSDNDNRSVSNAIATGGNGLTVSGASNLTLSGVISGTGSLTVNMTAAADVLTLSGTNTYSGGTTVTEGNLTGTTSSLQGNITNNATVTFNQATNGTYSDVISGTGALTKSGAGTITLSGNNTHSGLTTLAAGGLVLNGQVGGALTVTAGTLSGTGTIAGTLTLNGGTFRPGNSIGTTTIGGNYVQNAGSTLEVEVSKGAGGALSNDFLDVTGSATLNAGSTINVLDVSPSGYIIATGDTFQIIQADGGVTDNGPTITDDSAVLSFSGGVSGNFYQLVASRQAFSAVISGGNNSNTLAAIDSDMSNATGDYVTLINALTALNATRLNNAAEQLNPSPHASTTNVSLRTAQRMAGSLANYLSARRSGVERVMSFNAPSQQNQLMIADASSDPRMLAYAINESRKMTRMQDEQRQTANKISGFFRPIGLFYEHDSTSKMTGFRAKALGAQFGIDKRYGPNMLVGIGGGYSHSFIYFKKSRGEADTDSIRLGPYASYFKDNLFVDASLSFGYHDNENKRDIRFARIDRTAEGNYNAYDLSAYIGGGYDFHLDDWTITPTTSLQYIRYCTESFREGGAGAAGLDVGAVTSESLRSKLGVAFSTVTELYGTKVVPELFGGWAHEFMDEEDITARFVQGTAKFTTEVNDGLDDSMYFGAGLSALLNENTSAFVRYEGEYSSGIDITSLNVGITFLF